VRLWSRSLPQEFHSAPACRQHARPPVIDVSECTRLLLDWLPAADAGACTLLQWTGLLRLPDGLQALIKLSCRGYCYITDKVSGYKLGI
jgi:hypothetical protein